MPILEQALELAEQLELAEVYSQALSSKAIVLMQSDRLAEAGLLLRDALEVAEEHGLTDAAMRAYINLGEVLQAQDRFAEVVALGERQLAAARRTGSSMWELTALTNSIGTLVQLGRWDQALAWAKEARGAEELAAQEWSAAGLVALAPLHAGRGELGEAKALLDSQRDAESSTGWDLRLFNVITKAQLLLLEGRPADALAALEEAMAVREELGIGMSNTVVKRALVTAVEAALSLGDLARADELLEVVRSARPGQVTPWLRAQMARLTARADDLRGAQGAVEAGFGVSENGLRGLGAVFDLAVVLTEHTEWLAAQGQLETAKVLRGEAQAIWEQLRAQLWLERLDRIPTGQSQTA
jgi:tetratricopeptide (TPR) repeat protein